MASTGRTMSIAIGAAGAAALCSTAFVAPTQTKSLRANRAVEAASAQSVDRITGASSSSSALNVGVGAASAALALGAASKRVAYSGSSHSVVAVRAFESELGVQDPVGFWDPVGFTSDGDVSSFKRRRSVELKHGRISMMATMGYITPEITGKLPGFLSPSAGLKFADIPNGLAAVSKAPVGFWDPAGFTKDGNAENFARRRQTELKHGRIAMLATMGYITPEFSKWPGYLSPTLGIKFADVPNGLAAISKVPISGWTQILLWGAYCETSQDQSPGTPGAAGDFGWKVLTSDDAETKTKKLAAELANGRLAMMAIIGMFFQVGR
ncbi:unnamed protein product [Symbiodinium sp. CCMP2456]|nr:unnamed protein product [Symbiodinium sp. CCMP2456]